MAHKTNLPAKQTPLKASYYNNRAVPDPAIEARRIDFWERVKTSDPILYQKYRCEESAGEAGRIVFEASLDDPETIALFEYFSEKMQRDQQNKLNDEMTLLGIEAGATKREIRNAYRRKARKLHPDAGGSDEAFKQLHTAYRRLLASAKA